MANGLGQSLASLSRTVGPMISGALWGPSVRLHLLALNFILGSGILLVALNIKSHLVPLDGDVYSPASASAPLDGDVYSPASAPLDGDVYSPASAARGKPKGGGDDDEVVAGQGGH